MTEFLVTGGAGFIGSNVVRHLLDNGRSVRILDNLLTGRLSNIDDLLGDVDFMEGDLRDEDAVAGAVEGVKYVLHFAALPSVPRSVADPVKTDAINIGGTVKLLVASRDAGVERFVFSSSSSVYGNTEVLPKQEDMPTRPLSPYAVQKLAGEHYCKVFHQLYGVNTFVLRYFNVFGPRQDPGSSYAAVVPLFIKAFASDTAPTIHGDGEQTRDFTFVDNVIAANLACCDAPLNAAGGVYNVACGVRTSVNELAMTIRSLLDKTIDPVYAPERAGDVRDSEGDATRAKTLLGWHPQTSLVDGLKATVQYYAREV